jgi:UPF0716 family protein affecting phage T7 exclusion
MGNQLTPEEMELLLKDMAEICLRPPEEYAGGHGPEGAGGQPPMSESGLEWPGRRLDPGALVRLFSRLDRSRFMLLGLLLCVALAPLAGFCLLVALAGPAFMVVTMAASAALGGMILLTQCRGAFGRLGQFVEGLVLGRDVPRIAIDRGLVLLGGMLLLLPDPVTDGLGLALLASPLRTLLGARIRRRLLEVQFRA